VKRLLCLVVAVVASTSFALPASANPTGPPGIPTHGHDYCGAWWVDGYHRSAQAQCLEATPGNATRIYIECTDFQFHWGGWVWQNDDFGEWPSTATCNYGQTVIEIWIQNGTQ
jgi:hypothetical protein